MHYAYHNTECTYKVCHKDLFIHITYIFASHNYNDVDVSYSSDCLRNYSQMTTSPSTKRTLQSNFMHDILVLTLEFIRSYYNYFTCYFFIIIIIIMYFGFIIIFVIIIFILLFYLYIIIINNKHYY
jgi:hypothetical protein